MKPSSLNIPCILHIGNILNNGYLHCKYLRKQGIPADSLNVDYRHCQGQPEWAEVYITEPIDEFYPDWSKADLKGFKRPRWFYDVSLNQLSFLASSLNGMKSSPKPFFLGILNAIFTGNSIQKLWQVQRSVLVKALGFLDGSPVLRRLRLEKSKRAVELSGKNDEAQALIASLVEGYASEYPGREPGLSEADVYEWLPRSMAYHPMLKRYQLIHAYSLDPIYVLLGNPGQPFICYEHGTMREFPFENSARGRLYSLALKKAEKVIITNADCVLSAQKLGLSNYVFIPHIIDDDLFKPEKSVLRDKFLKERGCEFILVAPSRHHWKHCPPGLENSWFKRNDILIRGLGRLFKKRPSLKALVVFFEWGQEVELSKQLIGECGFADKVLWKPILSKPALKEFYNAADVILDQFNNGIGTFGAVVPEGMACAKPVLLNYKKELHTWCYPQLPPALNAPDEEAIVKHLEDLLDDPGYCRQIGQAGRQWFKEYHSSRVVMDRLIDVYMGISDKYNWGWRLAAT
jgi:glycosyltransferase involved in cell wall biosynthesis